MSNRRVKLAFPKGRYLRDSKQTIREGFGVEIGEGVLRKSKGDYSFYLLKSKDIPSLVASGVIDFGVCPDECWLEYELGCAVRFTNRIVSFPWSHCSLAIFSSKYSEAESGIYVTPFPQILSSNIDGYEEIIPVTGSSEALISDSCHLGFDVVETGKTLERNNLHILKVVKSCLKVSLRGLLGHTKPAELEELQYKLAGLGG